MIPRRPNQGFSLIELMVVVAIIAILATLATSSINTLISKARQAEARAALGQLFTVQKIFYSEHSSYTLCLKQAGFSTLGSPNRYYFVGPWDSPLNNCGPTGTGDCSAYQWNPMALCSIACADFPIDKDDSGFRATVKESAAAPLLNTCPVGDLIIPAGWNVTKNTFLFGAAGNISKEPIFDLWTIDQTGKMTNVEPGL